MALLVYRRWGAFKESEWIGHSRRMREDHYLSITDDDFREAAGLENTPGEPENKTVQKNDFSAVFSAVEGQSGSKRVKVKK